MIPQSRISAQIRKIKKDQSEKESLTEEEKLNIIRKIPFTKMTVTEAAAKWRQWIKQQNYIPLPFQEEAWKCFQDQKSMLIAVPTGSGKTLAALGGPLQKLMLDKRPLKPTTRVIYITPLKALARDIVSAIERPLSEMQLPFVLGLRTGDSSAVTRRIMEKAAPDILVTTPESMAILLTQREVKKTFGDVISVIIDEGHELLGSKRGSLLELTLATLKQYSPNLQVTVLSATLGNLDQASQVLTGTDTAVVITDARLRKLQISVLTPENMTAAPWLGYAGLQLIEVLLKKIDLAATQILFCNTRANAEAWFRNILEHRPQWRPIMGLHHGSLAREERNLVEDQTKSGDLKLIVATSSLELGVDFPSVKSIFQIGSVKSLARAVQRAGRGYHRPGEDSHLTIVPSNLFEILEGSALRDAVKEGIFEKKIPLAKPLDVFLQFLLNRAFFGGFTLDEIKNTVSKTYSFKNILDTEIEWSLKFLTAGGISLQAYPQFLKLQRRGDRYIFQDSRIERLHRMNIGTIVSNDGIRVRFAGGKNIGTIDETFISKLKKGDVFQFAGRELEYISLQYTTLVVRLSNERPEIATVYTGNILSISEIISTHLRRIVDLLASTKDATSLNSTELKNFWSVIEKQKKVSHVPLKSETLVELWKSKEGHHLYLFSWAGRLVNEGLGHLFAFRIAQITPNTISVAASEHGFELLAAEPFPPPEVLKFIFSDLNQLDSDITHSLNFPELAKRSFREIARVSGLIQSSVAGQPKNQRNLQMSSGLLFDVFERYELNHPLVNQAKQDVQTNQLNMEKIIQEINLFKQTKFVFKRLSKLSPFAFPIYIERSRTRVSTEKLEQRIARFQHQILADT